MACTLSPKQITEFTVVGSNEDVTCVLNTIFNRTVDIFQHVTVQLELCPGKSITKIYTSSDPEDGLVDTETAKAWLNASNVSYTQETVIQVLGSASQVRELLWGNVEIRSLYVCSEFVYLQVDPALLRFTQEILSNCLDPSVVRCYKDVSLNCQCEVIAARPEIVQSVISSGGSPTGLAITLFGVEQGNSIYIAVQYVGDLPIVSVTDNINGSYLLAKQSLNINFGAQIWYLDDVDEGDHIITITRTDQDQLIIAEAVEVTGTANPSLDVDNNVGSIGTNNPQQDDFITASDNNLGLMSVIVRILNEGDNIEDGSDGSTVIESVSLPSLFAAGAVLQKLLGAAGSYFMQSITTGENAGWAASAVGIRGVAIPCDPVICRSPIPDCGFKYPCEDVKCAGTNKCKNDKKNKKHK